MNGRNAEDDVKQKKPDPGDGLDSMFALSYHKNGEESFPVLRAFQEFLEAERERARRKQLALTLTFMGVIVVLVLVFCVIGAVLFNTLLNQSNQQQGKLVELLLQQRQNAEPVEVAGAKRGALPGVKSEQADADATLMELMEAVEALRRDVAARKEEAKLSTPPAETAVAETPPPTEEELLRQKGIYTPLKWRTDNPAEAKAPPEPQPEKVESAEETPLVADVAGAVAVEIIPEEVKAEPTQPVEPTGHTAEIAALEPVKPEEAIKNTVDPEAATPEADVRRISVTPSREMGVPAGYKPAAITVVTEDRRSVPWRIMMPTGLDGEEAAE